MQSSLWLIWLYLVVTVIISIYLFLQGYTNIITGKVTKFGIDAVFRLFDSWTNNKKSRWGDAKRVRITGVIVLIMAVEAGISAILLLFLVILPRLK